MENRAQRLVILLLDKLDNCIWKSLVLTKISLAKTISKTVFQVQISCFVTYLKVYVFNFQLFDSCKIRLECLTSFLMKKIIKSLKLLFNQTSSFLALSFLHWTKFVKQLLMLSPLPEKTLFETNCFRLVGVIAGEQGIQGLWSEILNSIFVLFLKSVQCIWKICCIFSAPWTIISFPFLFAIMFGDTGHGTIMLLVALFFVWKEKQLQAKLAGDEVQ